MRNSTDPRQLEDYLEQKESYEGSLELDVERLVDSLQEWQHEAELQPRASFVNELAQQLYEQQRPASSVPGFWPGLWGRLLGGGLKAVVAVAAVALFAVWLLTLQGTPESPDATQPVAEVTNTIGAAETVQFEIEIPQQSTPEATSPVLDPPTPTSQAAATEPTTATQPASCNAVPRPALLLGSDISLDRLNLTVVNPFSGAHCSMSTTNAYSAGAVAVSGNTLYYPHRDREAGTITIWEHPFDGNPQPLPFTTTPALSAPWFGLTVSDDGRYLVWATFSDQTGDASNARYRSTVWLGDLEAGTATLLWQEDAPDTLPSTIEPLHYSAAENAIYFARRPHGIGGVGPYAGQYSGLYTLSLDGGEPQPLFTCQTEFDFCLNDVDFERRLLATVTNENEQPELRIIAFDGSTVASYSPSDANYVAQPVFSPGGDVAFIAANLERAEDRTPRFQPGSVRLLRAPYSEQPQTLFEETDAYFGLWHWVDSNHLLVSGRTAGQSLGLLNLSGEWTTIPESGNAVPITGLQEP